MINSMNVQFAAAALRDTATVSLLGVYAIAIVVAAILSPTGPYATLVSSVALLIGLGIIHTSTPTYKTPPATSLARLQWLAAVSWLVVLLAISWFQKGSGIFDGEPAKWLSFVIVPTILLFIVWRGHPGEKWTRTFGIVKHGSLRAILIGVMSIIPGLAAASVYMPTDQRDRLIHLASNPLNLLVAIPMAFLFAFLTAAFTEEYFFRGILQTRLASVLQNQVRAWLIISLLFGLYHLPYAYFSPDWPTHGNIIWALTSVITEQGMTGLLLGALLLRTGNLWAPIFAHATINALALMTMIKFG